MLCIYARDREEGLYGLEMGHHVVVAHPLKTRMIAEAAARKLLQAIYYMLRNDEPFRIEGPRCGLWEKTCGRDRDLLNKAQSYPRTESAPASARRRWITGYGQVSMQVSHCLQESLSTSGIEK